MEQVSKEQILKRYHLLSKSLQSVLFDERTSDTIHKTCLIRDAETHTSTIAKLTGRVLLGYLRPELFALEIQKETGIDMQKAQLVAHDLDMEIFSAVRLELKKLYPPTIQTPTVQTWMAQKTELQKPELRIMNYELRKEGAAAPAAKPKYVIPIPEKFLRQTTDNQMQNVMRPDLQQPINEPTPVSSSKTNSAGGNLKSAGGGQVSQIAKETSGNQGAEARPLEEKSNMARSDLQQPANQESGITNQELRIMNEEALAKEKGSAQTVIHNSNFIIRESKEQGQPTENTQAKQTPQETFKPIVPLPTFIQTQFRTTQVGNQESDKTKNQEINKSENQPPNSTLANDPRIKSILSKFTTSSTQKPKPPAESPYKEKI